MTQASASWADVEKFLGVDGWRQVPARERGGRRQTHIFFEKLLPDRRLLQTHIFQDRSKKISPGRFGTILREQLEVSRADFWKAIRSGEPVSRPVETEEAPVEHDAWVIAVLVGELHMSPVEIEGLSGEEAIRLVHEHWARGDLLAGVTSTPAALALAHQPVPCRHLRSRGTEKISALSESRANPYELPADLPVPEDDGGADHLPDARVPSVVLPETDGDRVDLAAAAAGDGFLIVYVYPQTGVPGRQLPRDWDSIPGARGCTPQSCAFRDSARELTGLGASVFGLSAQPLAEQREFAAREHLPYPLLNDSGFRLAEDLGLPTFEANGVRYYRRLTFIARRGRIAEVFYPVFPPQNNADDVIAWLRACRR